MADTGYMSDSSDASFHSAEGDLNSVGAGVPAVEITPSLTTSVRYEDGKKIITETDADGLTVVHTKRRRRVKRRRSSRRGGESGGYTYSDVTAGYSIDDRRGSEVVSATEVGSDAVAADARAEAVEAPQAEVSDGPFRVIQPFPWCHVTDVPHQHDPEQLPEAIIGRMEPMQREAIANVRERMLGDDEFDDEWVDHYCDDLCIARFLKARGWDEDKALAMLSKTQVWMDTEAPEYAICEACMEDEHAHNLSVYGLDHMLRPVVYTCFKETNNRDTDMTVRHTIACMEASIRAMAPGVQQWIWIIDFKGFGFAFMNPSVGSQTIGLLSDHYPERLGAIYLVDTPRLFSGLYSALKAFIDEETKKKVHFVSSDDFHGLFEEIVDPDLHDTIRAKMDGYR